MAATKIIEIKQTVGHALRYIADPAKTENGRNILDLYVQSRSEQGGRRFF